jgi:hypothetical protein
MASIRRTTSMLVLAALVSVGAGSLDVTAVSAAPAAAGVHASTVPCGYPPGSCLVLFNKGGYKHGQHVHFKTTIHSFNAHGKVRIRITGPHGYHRTLHLRHASSRGAVTGLFKILKHLRLGKYTMTLHGHKHGRVQIIMGHFRVRH